MPTIIDLGGSWTCAEASSKRRIPARVPGCVHADLRRAGRLPELWWREQRPWLVMGPGSWGWVERAYASTRVLEAKGQAREDLQRILAENGIKTRHYAIDPDGYHFELQSGSTVAKPVTMMILPATSPRLSRPSRPISSIPFGTRRESLATTPPSP